ncbi:MAG: ATP synthase F1 subunit delta [Longimicrobiales bacterium]|nr:ATP synthase F1 subunit delta [Longimicrobiales bacterium]
MRDEIVSRNYAEALFELGKKHDLLESFQEGIEAVARLLDESPDFRLFIETPRIDAPAKKDVVRKAFGQALPKPLLNFVLITIDKRRQRLLRDIARAYQALMDEHLGRTHVEISVARELDDETINDVARKLSALLDTEAIPHVRVRPEILGGVVVRTGDRVYDGSLRRRLEGMRRRLQQADLPEAGELPVEG